MTKPGFRSIKEEGLFPYLKRTKVQHNNVGPAQFIKLINGKISNAAGGRIMSVGTTTFKHWRDLYQAGYIEADNAVDELSNV